MFSQKKKKKEKHNLEMLKQREGVETLSSGESSRSSLDMTN
jgi:hypothetical protein